MPSSKGSGGARRWITRRPIDSRPIIGLYHTPGWILFLERHAWIVCIAIGLFSLALAAYAYATDYSAGHLL